VRGAQYAVDLANQKISEAAKGYSTAGSSSTSTVNRGAIDAAVSSVINNDKVTTPAYTTAFSIYSNLKDEELVYAGSDPIILANINAERARRGLPPILTA
jgi:predicted ATPase